MTGLERWKEMTIKLFRAELEEKNSMDVVMEILENKDDYKPCRWCAYSNNWEKCSPLRKSTYHTCREGIKKYLDSEVNNNAK